MIFTDAKEVKAAHIPENWTPVTFERKRDCEKFTVTRQIGCGKIGAYYVVRNPTAFKDGWQVCNTIAEVRNALTAQRAASARRYWVKYEGKYSRLVIANDKLQARIIARDEYDDENKVRDERGNRVVTPLYAFQADYVGPACAQ